MSTWIMTISALDASDQPVTLRFASGEYSSTDGYYYEARIKQPALFKAGAYGSSIVSADSSYGEAVLVNNDGGLDYLADYAVDGRDCIISVVDGLTITQYMLVKILRLNFENNQVSLILRSPLEDLTQAHPQNTYGGTNTLPDGIDGLPDDIKGLTKPKVYGKVRNAEPVLVNTVRYIYQVHEGANVTVASVYDRGVALTKGADYFDLAALQATAPAAGEFRCYQGYFRLGAVPSGQVTCDADNVITLAGQVLETIAIEAGKIIDAAGSAALDTVGEVGIYLNDTRTTADLINLITESAGAFWSWDATGKINATLLAAPATSANQIYDYQINDISRSATAAGANGLPIWKVTIHADQIETVQTDLAASVDSTRRGRLASKARDAIFAIDTIKTRHPLATDLVIDSCLRNQAEAQLVAQRLAELLSVRRDAVSATVTLDADSIALSSIGTQLNLQSEKLGYSNGRDLIVIGYQPDIKRRRVILDLWG